MRCNAKSFDKSYFALLFIILAMALCSRPCLAVEGPSASEYGVVLNLSGKQRMLTQKMSKEVLLIARKIDVESNLNSLKATSELFDKTLIGLLEGDKELNLPPTVNFPIKMQLGKVQLLWSRFYPPIQEILENKTVTEDQAWQIAEKNLHLLKEMAKCVSMYEKDAAKAGLKANPSLAVSINLSGKQRMLTQKMSKEFLLIAYGHKVEKNKENLRKTYALFERTLVGLINGDEGLNLTKTDNEVITNQLFVVKDLWKAFKPIVAGAAENNGKPITTDQIKTLSKDNLVLLKEMNKAVGLYEKEA